MSVVEVTAASRLHFGLYSFGRSEGPQFGGMGAMVESPELRLRISSDERFSADGPLADRAVQASGRVFESLAIESGGSPIACRIEILSAPRQHVGLGVGTQLALSVTAGLRRWLGLPNLAPHELAAAAGRGERSGIGTHGFFQGGWLVEAGKRQGETLSPLVRRLAMPESWRFVLAIPKSTQGLHGPDERRAFADLPPVPHEVTERLQRIAMDGIAPALAAADFAAVCESLYRFNHEAGLCFAARQHGAYADESTAALVEKLRSWGVAGVGQSSWGPTVFALQWDLDSATRLVSRLQSEAIAADRELVIAAPANRGAQIALR